MLFKFFSDYDKDGRKRGKLIRFKQFTINMITMIYGFIVLDIFLIGVHEYLHQTWTYILTKDVIISFIVNYICILLGCYDTFRIIYYNRK